MAHLNQENNPSPTTILDNLQLWKGSWKSNTYLPFTVWGDVYVYLPKNEYTNGYKTDVYIMYKGYYRYGQQLKIPVELKVSLSQGNDNNENPSIQARGDGTIPFGFSMKLNSLDLNQHISFETQLVTSDLISGIYESKTPHDKGQFKLEKSDWSTIPTIVPLNNYNNCNLL
jgi:hypothetical protein